MAKPQAFEVRPKVTREEQRAIIALSRGEATPGQQTLALHTIVNKFSRTHDVLFVPGEADQTAFLNGRSFVGTRILQCLNIPVGQLTETTHDDTGP